MDITVVSGKNSLVAIYDDKGQLIATHDKHTQRTSDFDRQLGILAGKEGKVTEEKGSFSKFTEIPKEHKVKTPAPDGGKTDKK